MHRIPRALRVNGRTVRLVARQEARMPSAYGRWHESRHLIEYRTRMPNDIKRDTVLHEVMHAIRSLQGRESGGAVEEDYVRSIATGLIGVLDDNPEFARWLITKQ